MIYTIEIEDILRTTLKTLIQVFVLNQGIGFAADPNGTILVKIAEANGANTPSLERFNEVASPPLEALRNIGHISLAGVTETDLALRRFKEHIVERAEALGLTGTISFVIPFCIHSEGMWGGFILGDFNQDKRSHHAPRLDNAEGTSFLLMLKAHLEVKLENALLYGKMSDHIDVLKKALELERSNEALMQFAHAVAHDLKQPLHNIIGFSHILEDHYKERRDAEVTHDILLIVRSASRMAAIIDDLLLYAKAGSGGLNIQSVCIEGALQSALENLNTVIEESRAVITHHPLPMLRCDETQIVCLLQNLIDNAIKFRGSAPPHVEISAKIIGPEWVFSVHDNGIGIDPKYHGKIFKMLERLHTQTAYPGTGIGLAICQKIVERHKGRLSVDSRLGEGTTFSFTFPAAQGQHEVNARS